jgi:hypothetical protein
MYCNNTKRISAANKAQSDNEVPQIITAVQQ